MGMGKSLSVLALILRTLEAAHQWSVKPESNSAQHWRSKPQSSATLIVASSDRKYMAVSDSISETCD
jgi:SWI/SNF-related matrix-associated actin-dependent regulator of chromatin subfamily A3